MKAVILISCEGYQQNGFHFCYKVENIVLDLEKIEGSENYFNLIQYLDSVVKLFEQPCGKQSLVTSATYKFYEMGYINDQMQQYIGHFYKMHCKCNLLLTVKLKKDNNG
ncbi:hypothetical protein LCGC14_1454610 [marine sediment metagenome]|uniref:Uncharacterized protein n=1 Tax=marine sediment metagenome TaxID=412755 RepID=A0A0F9MIQ0_9ZZZZ